MKQPLVVKSWKIKTAEVRVLDRGGSHEIWVSDMTTQIMLAEKLDLFKSTLQASLLADIIRNAVEGRNGGHAFAKKLFRAEINPD